MVRHSSRVLSASHIRGIWTIVADYCNGVVHRCRVKVLTCINVSEKFNENVVSSAMCGIFGV